MLMKPMIFTLFTAVWTAMIIFAWAIVFVQ